MMPKIVEKRREFFKNCEYITKAPACIFLKGNRFSRKAKVLPIPLYAYAGIEKGDFEKFEYEEFGEKGEIERLDEARIENYRKDAIIKLLNMPPEERERVENAIPISSWRRHRELYYPLFFEIVMKRRIIFIKVEKKFAIESGFFVERLSKERLREIERAVKSEKFKDYFKIKVYSEISSDTGLNEGAAIAAAVSFLLKIAIYESEEYRKKMLIRLEEEKEGLQEGIVPKKFKASYTFLNIFEDALKLDFFSNGAAVFASLLGISEPYKIIDYESLIYDVLDLFFTLTPEDEKGEIRSKGKIMRFKERLKEKFLQPYSPYYNYLKEKEKLSSDLKNGKYLLPWSAIRIKHLKPQEKVQEYFVLPFAAWQGNLLPLFKWNYCELTNKKGQILSLIKRQPIEGHEFKNPNPKPNSDFKYWDISPFCFAIFGDSAKVAEYLKDPEKHIFEKFDFPAGSFTRICSLSEDKWRVEGVKLVATHKPEKPPKAIIKIDFSDKKEIWVNGKRISMKSKKGVRQEFLLLEELLNRKVVHWSRGFVLFKKWQENVPKRGSVEQFRHVVSELNSILGVRLIVPHKVRNLRVWRLDKSFKIETTIKEAECLCKQARKLKDGKEIIKQLQEAILLYPESIEISKLLIYFSKELKNELNFIDKFKEEIFNAKILLEERENNLRKAIEMIQREGNKHQWEGIWKEAKIYTWKMIKEFTDIQQYRIMGESLIDENIKVNSDEARCRALIEMINIIKNNPEDRFTDFIRETPEMQKVIKIVSSKFIQKVRENKWKEEGGYDEIERNAVLFLWKEFKTWKNPVIRKVSELENYLIGVVFYRLLVWFIEDKFGVPKEKQHALWRLKSVREKIKEKIGSYPRVEILVKELGSKWSREKVEELTRYEGNMLGFIDIDKEYRYFDKLKLDLERYLKSIENSLEF